jgi:hypothetical protein
MRLTSPNLLFETSSCKFMTLPGTDHESHEHRRIHFRTVHCAKMMRQRCRLFVVGCILLSNVDAWSLRGNFRLSPTLSQEPPTPQINGLFSNRFQLKRRISNKLRKRSALSSHGRRFSVETTSILPTKNVESCISKSPRTAIASLVLSCTLLTSSIFSMGSTPSVVYGYGESQYLSDTVKVAIREVEGASSKKDIPNDALVKAYENISEIITEGKGVGGAINFQGVQLDRGFVSDEDTTIYNPGLTLLTETEKDRLVDAIVESKKRQMSNSNNVESWSDDLEAGYSFLRERLDPLHMYELRGYLSIVPWYGAFMYLVALAVQQSARETFPIAYLVCAAAVFLPIAALVVLGP